MDDVQQLVDCLDETASLLKQYGESHWSEWILKNRHKITSGNFQGVLGLLEGYGGMGSFNDIYIHSANGHMISEQAVNRVNEQFRSLQGNTYRLAERIKTEVESG